MSWHFLQGQEEGFWEENSLDGAPSALLSLLNFQEKCCSQGNEMDCSKNFQYGMMSEHSMDTRGKGLSMSFQEVFRARILAWPGKDWDWMERVADYGVKCSASFARWSPDTYSWKTRQCSLLGGLESYLGIWPRWGLMRDGECWALPMLEPRTYASEYGLWPTPCKFDQTKSMPHEMEIRNGRPTTISSKGKKGSSPLRAWAAVFPQGSLEVGEHWPAEPGLARMVHGVADGVDRIGAIGNGQVPRVVALAWMILSSQRLNSAAPAGRPG